MPRTAPSKRSQQSQARNRERVVISVEMEGEVEFGRIVRNLGGRNMIVLNQDRKECMAHIPGALAHRSSTPIITGSLVVIVPREYESRAGSEKRYDIFAVVQDKKDIRVAIKEGKIPNWLLNQTDSAVDEDGVEFDYISKEKGDKSDKDGEDEGLDEKELDIDTI